MAGEKNNESSDQSYVSDNLLLTVRSESNEVFISTHGTFYKGSLEELMSFLLTHVPQHTKTTQDNGTNTTSN